MEQNSQTKIITSQNEEWPLSFRCPEDWEARDIRMKEGVKFFLRGPLGQAEHLFPAITVRARPGKGRILSGLDCEWTGRRGAFRTFRLLARTETTVANSEAMMLDAAHEMPASLDSPTPGTILIRERVILALRDERIYELAYRTAEEDFDEFLAVFEDLIASFELKNAVLT